MIIAQHHQTAKRCAGHHAFLPRGQQTHIGNAKPVHILGRINRVDHKVFVQMIGQRQLHQNTMHRRVIVQAVNQCQQIGLRGFGIQLVLIGIHPDLDGHLSLGAHINLRCGVFAHQHHGQTRRDAVIILQPRHMHRHLFPNLGRKGLAVDNICCHFSGLVHLMACHRQTIHISHAIHTGV